jgi:hypothetical protein
MPANRAKYGFRFFRGIDGSLNMPAPEEMIVATSQSFDVSGGAANVYLRPGDPVIKLSTGGVNLCNGTENSQTAVGPYGIVVGIKSYWDGTVMKPSNRLPSDIAWGTNLDRQSKVYVIPFNAAIWEIDVDDSSTATTEAAYQAFIGENADYQLKGASGESYAAPRLDISTHATTNTPTCRIVGVSPSMENRYFDGDYVKLLVRANLAQVPHFGSVAQPTQNSATGV